MCDCGDSVENAQHIHLDCRLFSDFRLPLFREIDDWLEKVKATESSASGWTRMDRAEALRWVHYNTPLVMDPVTAGAGEAVRQAALAFYSRVQQRRYLTGCFHRAPSTEPLAITANNNNPPHTLAQGPPGLG